MILFFKSPCLSCDAPVPAPAVFCENCALQIRDLLLVRNPCGELEGLPISAAARYEGPMAQALRIMKVQPYGALGSRLEKFLFEIIFYWTSELRARAYDAIVIVPSDPMRVFFQTDLAAFAGVRLSQALDLPLWASLLRRHLPDPFRASTLQKTLGRQQRRALGAQGEIYLDARQLKLFKDKNYSQVLLVDDICATGATLQACVSVLRAEIPEQRHHAWVLARSFLRHDAYLSGGLIDPQPKP